MAWRGGGSQGTAFAKTCSRQTASCNRYVVHAPSLPSASCALKRDDATRGAALGRNQPAPKPPAPLSMLWERPSSTRFPPGQGTATRDWRARMSCTLGRACSGVFESDARPSAASVGIGCLPRPPARVLGASLSTCLLHGQRRPGAWASGAERATWRCRPTVRRLHRDVLAPCIGARLASPLGLSGHAQKRSLPTHCSRGLEFVLLLRARPSATCVMLVSNHPLTPTNAPSSEPGHAACSLQHRASTSPPASPQVYHNLHDPRPTHHPAPPRTHHLDWDTANPHSLPETPSTPSGISSP